MDFGSLILGALVGAIPSWYISKHFAASSSKELDHKFNSHASKIGSATTFNNFERMLRSSKWRKEIIGHSEVWICEDNNTFQIKAGGDRREFRENWTSVFPDQNASMFHINLTVNSTIVKSLPFISADGGRYTLPLPELEVVGDKSLFFWAPNSVEVKVAEIIGNFYRYKSIREVARFTKIEMYTGGSHA